MEQSNNDLEHYIEPGSPRKPLRGAGDTEGEAINAAESSFLSYQDSSFFAGGDWPTPLDETDNYPALVGTMTDSSGGSLFTSPDLEALTGEIQNMKFSSPQPKSKSSFGTPNDSRVARGKSADDGSRASQKAVECLKGRKVKCVSTKETATKTISERTWGVLEKSLAETLRIVHDDEATFDLTFFKTFAKNYGQGAVNLYDKFIVLEEHGDYAIALARQIHMRELWFGERLGPASADSHCDHAVVVLKKNNAGGWDIEACTKSIEFKTKAVADKWPKKSKTPSSSFAQATLYVATMVVPSLAYFGLPKEIQNPIAVPMMTCCTRKDDNADELPCVDGYLYLPRKCGGQYIYISSVVGKGVNDAVNLYMENIDEGVALANKGIKNLIRNKIKMVPLSGQMPPFGKSDINIELTATAVQSTTHRIKVNYGDMWKGTTSFGKLSTAMKEMENSGGSFHTGESDEQISVVVKSSNALMHGGWAMSAVDCMSALNSCKEILTDYSSLLYAQVLDAGLLIVMKDLHVRTSENPSGFLTLTPQTWSDKGLLGCLWAGFADLTTDVLIPMAKNNVVFTDLRFGYDTMGNIMVGGLADQWPGENKIPKLELIDFDSLSFRSSYVDPDDQRYIAECNYDAMTFVFIQVFLTGISWMNKVEQADFNANQHSVDIFNILCNIAGGVPGLLYRMSCAYENVEILLIVFARLLKKNRTEIPISDVFTEIKNLPFKKPTFADA